MSCHNITLKASVYTILVCAPSTDVMLSTLVRREMRNDVYGLTRHRFETRGHMLDIGGHVGTTAIFAALLNPRLHVHTYEPSAENCAYLRQNVKRYHLEERISVIEASVAMHDRGVTFVYSPDDTTSSKAAHLGHPWGKLPKVVRYVPTDDVSISWRTMIPLHLIKVDCEGCETDIFPVLKRIQQSSPGTVLIGEFHEWHLKARSNVSHVRIDYARRAMCSFAVRNVERLRCL